MRRSKMRSPILTTTSNVAHARSAVANSKPRLPARPTTRRHTPSTFSILFKFTFRRAFFMKKQSNHWFCLLFWRFCHLSKNADRSMSGLTSASRPLPNSTRLPTTPSWNPRTANSVIVNFEFTIYLMFFPKSVQKNRFRHASCWKI